MKLRCCIFFLIILGLLSCSRNENGSKSQYTKDKCNKSFYCADDFALFRLERCNDLFMGSMFWINRKDSLNIRGTIRNGALNFNDEWGTLKEGFISDGNITFLTGLIIDTLVLYSISQINYYSLMQEALAPPKLSTLMSDTVIDNYRFEIRVENWNPETFYGNSTVTIKNEQTNVVLQEIVSDNFQFNENISFSYEDWNFDYVKDLIFFNGHNGGYSSPTYDFYIYDKAKRQFVYNEQLADITGHSGAEIDKKKKRIISYAKSGCCWHEQKAYYVRNNKFIEYKNLVEDNRGNGVIVTIGNRINGKWRYSEKHYPEITEEEMKRISDSF